MIFSVENMMNPMNILLPDAFQNPHEKQIENTAAENFSNNTNGREHSGERLEGEKKGDDNS